MRPFAIALVLAALASSAGSSAAAPPPLLVGDNGLPAAVRAGAARYFAWIDSRGGVNGRRIAFRAATPAEARWPCSPRWARRSPCRSSS